MEAFYGIKESGSGLSGKAAGSPFAFVYEVAGYAVGYFTHEGTGDSGGDNVVDRRLLGLAQIFPDE